MTDFDMTPPRKASLRRGSRTATEEALHELHRQFEKSRWLGPRNRYLRDTYGRLGEDAKNKTIKDAHLRQYIAASAPLHCLDGWGFLSRAVEAHCAADYHAARHLAYYAELRAAMSILAGQGVGIFNSVHFRIDAKKQVHELFRGQTHKAIWPALRYWSGLDRASALLSQTVSPSGIDLSDWLAFFGTAASARPLAARWLRTWGLDLRELSADHLARNYSSYRPTGFAPGGAIPACDTPNFARDLWTLSEPSSVPFFKLDRHLLRLSLEQAFRGTTGLAPVDAPQPFKGRVDSMLTAAGMEGTAFQEWSEFLTRAKDPETPLILTLGTDPRALDDRLRHLQMMARAALLLRIATGSSQMLLRTNSITAETLRFWWEPIGTQRGFWEDGSPPTPLTSSWADIEEALAEVGNWQGSVGNPSSYRALRTGIPRPLTRLGGLELAGLWGLGL